MSPRACIVRGYRRYPASGSRRGARLVTCPEIDTRCRRSRGRPGSGSRAHRLGHCWEQEWPCSRRGKDDRGPNFRVRLGCRARDPDAHVVTRRYCFAWFRLAQPITRGSSVCFRKSTYSSHPGPGKHQTWFLQSDTMPPLRLLCIQSCPAGGTGIAGKVSPHIPCRRSLLL